MTVLVDDARAGLRTLWRHRAFSAAAAGVLAVGIGSSAAMFSVFDAVLLKPLDYPDPAQLVVIGDRSAGPSPTATSAGVTGTGPAFLALRDRNRAFTQVSAIGTYGTEFNLAGGDRPERIRAASASFNYFDMLGVPPILGRTFRPDEELPGHRIAVLTNRLWRTRFGSDPGILGRAISLDETAYTVVGVLPAQASLDRVDAAVWTPIVLGPDEQRLDNYFLNVYARLRPGVTRSQATQDVQRVYDLNADASRAGRIAVVDALRDRVVDRDLRRTLWLLMGSVSLLLVIACANVANLLLARGVARSREVAIRTSLGATRARLVRQFLTESVLLALLGGALGIGLSVALLKSITAILPAGLVPSGAEIAIDLRTLGFALAVSLCTGILFGSLPALRANPRDSSLRRESGLGARGRGPHRLLLGAEVALMFVLLVVAALLLRSFTQLLGQDPGLRAAHVLTMNTVLPKARFPNAQRILAYERALLTRLEAMPGIDAAAATNVLPFSGRNQSTALSIRGRREGGVDVRGVTPGYAATMGIAVLEGRFLTADDVAQNARVTVVNQTMARRFWPPGEAAGQQVQIGDTIHTVIGVIADVRHRGLATAAGVEAYVPQTSRSDSSLRRLTFVVRTTADADRLAATVTRAAADVDPEQPIFDVVPMAELVADSVARPRFRVSLVGTFGGLALVLVAAGIYGVVSYSVARRTREIGIRMALGARPAGVVGLVVREAWLPVASGVLIGAACVLTLGRVMSAFLFQVQPTDLSTLAAAGCLIVAVTAGACLAPARRAMRVDPLVALRSE